MNWTRIHLRETDSTNNYLHALTAEGNFLITTDYQSSGRGQGANTWESQRGKNLLFSLRISPAHLLATHQFYMSMAGALAVKTALDGYATGFSVKWPNDVYYGDCKISGTLIETTLTGRFVSDIILGVGINVNQSSFCSAPNPISLLHIVGRELSREKLLADILSQFDLFYAQVEQDDYSSLSHAYHQSLYRLGTFHPYEDANGRFTGKILRVNVNGHLLIETTDGDIREYEFRQLKFVI